MRYYFSGLDPRYQEAFDGLQTGVLFRWDALIRQDMFEVFLRFRKRGTPMVLDSGINVTPEIEDTYIEFLDFFADDFQWFCPWDVFGSFSESNGNYNYLRDYVPRSLHHKLLYVLHGSPAEGFTKEQYHTLVTVLDQATPYIGIGGLVVWCRRNRLEVVTHYLDAIYTKMGHDACQYMHLLGIGNYRVIKRFCSKFGSADSSSWLCGVRGEQLQEDGKRLQMVKPFDKKKILRDNVEMILRWCASENDNVRLPKKPPSIPRSNPDPYILSVWPEHGAGTA